MLLPIYAEIRGGAPVRAPEPAILTWGTQLQLWRPGATPQVLLENRDFREGGCVADINNDGRDDLLVLEGTRLLLLETPDWRGRVIEHETAFRDCLSHPLDGSKGVFVPHFHAQLRHYALENATFGRFRDVYSIYTPSRQAGLLAHDVDDDGLADLFLGNYWLRNPGPGGGHWRLYAINTFYETEDAASAVSALLSPSALVWLESRASPARAVILHKPADPRQLWRREDLPGEYHFPRGLLVRERGTQILIGDRDGVALLRRDRKGWRASRIAQGFAVLALSEIGGAIYAVSPEGVRAVDAPRR